MADQDPGPSDTERFLLHLLEAGGANASFACPVCNTHNWDILGLVFAIDPVNSRPGVQVGRHMMQVVCRTCSYLMHFLWEPIRQKQFSSEALEALRQGVREVEVEMPATSGGRHGE